MKDKLSSGKTTKALELWKAGWCYSLLSRKSDCSEKKLKDCFKGKYGEEKYHKAWMKQQQLHNLFCPIHGKERRIRYSDVPDL